MGAECAAWIISEVPPQDWEAAGDQHAERDDADNQMPAHVAAAAATSTEQPGGGALPSACLQMGRTEEAPSTFSPYCPERAVPEGAILLSQGQYSWISGSSCLNPTLLDITMHSSM